MVFIMKLIKHKFDLLYIMHQSNVISKYVKPKNILETIKLQKIVFELPFFKVC